MADIDIMTTEFVVRITTTFHRGITVAVKVMIAFGATEMIDTTTGMIDTKRIEEEGVMMTMMTSDIVGIAIDQTVAIAPMNSTIPIVILADLKVGIPSIVVVDSDLGTLPVTTMMIMTIMMMAMIIITKKRKSNPQKNKKNGHHPFKKTGMPFHSMFVRPCSTNHCPISSMTQRASCTMAIKSLLISDTTKRKIHPLWRYKRWKRWKMQEKTLP